MTLVHHHPPARIALGALVVAVLMLAGCASNDATPAASVSPAPTVAGTTTPAVTPSATTSPTAAPTASASATPPAATPTSPPPRTATAEPTVTPEGTPTVEPPIGGSGLYGVLTVGPMCPVVRVGVPCPDRRYEDTVRIETPSGVEIATAEANADGEYVIDLPAGSYRVVPLSPPNSPLPTASPVDATVSAGAWTRLDIAYDSGIR